MKQSQLPGLHTILASLCPRVPRGPRAAPLGLTHHPTPSLPCPWVHTEETEETQPGLPSSAWAPAARLATLPGCTTPGRNCTPQTTPCEGRTPWRPRALAPKAWQPTRLLWASASLSAEGGGRARLNNCQPPSQQSLESGTLTLRVAPATS